MSEVAPPMIDEAKKRMREHGCKIVENADSRTSGEGR